LQAEFEARDLSFEGFASMGMVCECLLELGHSRLNFGELCIRGLRAGAGLSFNFSHS
jgi:hypothetical protein